MTDNTQELDEILLHLQRTASELSIAKGLTYKQVSQRRKYQRTRAKQALLDWHNKQIEEVLDRLENQVKSLVRKTDGTSIGAEYIPLSAIEAERNKLKESKDGN